MMNKKESQFRFQFLVLDLLLLNFSFFILNYWKRETISLSPRYFTLLLICITIWFFVSLFTKKFHKNHYKSYADAVSVFAKSAIYNIYFVALLVVLFSLGQYSRIHVFGTWVLLFFLEAAMFSIYEILSNEKTQNSVILIFADFGLLSFSFFIINYYKRGTFKPNPEYEKIILILFGVWFICSFFAKKFSSYHHNYFYALTSCIKAAFLMVATVSVLIFAFRLFYFSRLQIYGSILMLLVGESLIYFIYFWFAKYNKTENDIESIEEIKSFFQQEDLPLTNKTEKTRNISAESVEIKLENNYLENHPWLFNFISQSIDLSVVGISDTIVLNTHDVFNVKVIDNNSKKLLANLHKLNDFRWINRYFLEVHKKITTGGYFVGKSHTYATHKKHILQKYPKYFREVIYGIDFIINRVFPKLPGIKKIYFFVTKGKNRKISRTEVLGRLYFCGFKVIAEEEHDRRLYFIAQKVRTISTDKSPSYGPIVKFNRVGAKNQIIQINKFRTMHPYSEYLQEFIYEKYNLKENGKFNNDFRISSLGKFMRKTWLDELPMLYNWIRGDIKIFGVRPLSLHYFNLYSSELKEIRRKVKPGLIPPFYADLPESFSEICDSEKKYIEAYLEKPMKTQLVYFSKAIFNIFIKGARSS